MLNILTDIEILVATSFAEANKIMRRNAKEILVAVVDLVLPDCKPGQAVLLTSSHRIPTIILTASEDKELKSLLLKKDILDYTNKNSHKDILYVANFVKKILRNYGTTALVVDDSSTSRRTIINELERLCINVLEASDGKEALSIMESNKGKISLVLTDYNMPNMDGIELTSKLRENYSKDVLTIIALSASEEEDILSTFLKSGADDFLRKPHKFSELNARVNANLDTLDLFQEVKDLANKDYLTGSYNRRFFFEASSAILDKNVRKDKDVAVATLDIDHFKNVNDAYGHDVGDVAIKEIAKILDKSLRQSDLVARFGGEEYCILLEDISIEDLKTIFEKIRLNFEENEIKIENLSFKYTVSLGVAYGKSKDINQLIKVSDDALYEAKDTGRNKVVIHKL